MRGVKEPQENNLKDIIEKSIKNFGWFYFGNKKFECPGLRTKDIKFYMKNNKLPPLCDNCYKSLIFWEGNYLSENLKNFFEMTDSFRFDYKGKFNEDVVVFYFRNRDKMLNFLDLLQDKMQEFNVKGKTDWRKACEKYQLLKPELWKNSREFIGKY